MREPCSRRKQKFRQPDGRQPLECFHSRSFRGRGSVCTAQAAEASGKTKQEELRRQLIVMTGWQYDDLPRLGEIPIPEEALLEEDPESDRTQALAANFSLAADRRRLENTDSGTAKDVLNQKVEAGQQKIEADIEAKYNSLMQAQTDYGQAKEEYRLAEES